MKESERRVVLLLLNPFSSKIFFLSFYRRLACAKEIWDSKGASATKTIDPLCLVDTLQKIRLKERVKQKHEKEKEKKESIHFD